MSRSNHFYTLLLIPERTQVVRKVIIPAWIVRGAAIALTLLALLIAIMLTDYWYVMSQIAENRQIKLENRKLKQQVQVYREKIGGVETTLERIKSFSSRLKIITNIEDRSGLISKLNEKLPDAQTQFSTALTSPNPTAVTPSFSSIEDDLSLEKDQKETTHKIQELEQEASITEQVIQDQYELLSDQKAFLSALPVKKPAVGYYTSGFGVRKSPYGGRTKMHEGLDIANHPGTVIRAPADGTVVHASTKPGYGQTVILDHGYGLETWYAHTRKITVNSGQKVKRGETIALLGNSGRSTGPHLHYEVRVNGIPVNPLSFILEN